MLELPSPSDGFDVTASLVVPVRGERERIITPTGGEPPSLKPSKRAKEPPVTPFTPVGIGKPMKITLEQLYVGDTARQRGELLVVSRTKDPEDATEASVAFHWWGERIEPRSHPNTDDGSAGSSIMHYAAAEAATKLEIAVLLKFDYFPEDVVAAWRKAVVGIGKLPILLGGMAFGPGGAAAAQAVVGVADAGSELVVNLLDRTIDGSGAEVLGGDLTIAHPGRTEAQAGYLVLTQDTYEVRSRGASGGSVLTGYASNDGYRSRAGDGGTRESIDIDGKDFYVSSTDGELKHASDGTWDDGSTFEQGDTVEGPWHYAVILIDGAPDRDLKKWRPAAVTADLAAKFLNRPKDSELPSLTQKVFSSYSDAMMIERAAGLEAEITATAAAIKKARAGEKQRLEEQKELLEKQRGALIDAIEDGTLKELVTG